MARFPIPRRLFLGSLLAGAAVAAVTVWRWPARVLRDPPEPLPAEFVRQLRGLVPADAAHEDAVQAAAAALRERAGDWLDVPSALQRVRGATFGETLSSIRGACRDDYVAGRTVSVVGWVISRTEAELITLLR